jgi:hypothetical protein
LLAGVAAFSSGELQAATKKPSAIIFEMEEIVFIIVYMFMVSVTNVFCQTNSSNELCQQKI